MDGILGEIDSDLSFSRMCCCLALICSLRLTGAMHLGDVRFGIGHKTSTQTINTSLRPTLDVMPPPDHLYPFEADP